MNTITTVGAEEHDMIGRDVELLFGDEWRGPYRVHAYTKWDDVFFGTRIRVTDMYGSTADQSWSPSQQIRYV